MHLARDRLCGLRGLAEQLVRIRDDRWATSVGEREPGVSAVATTMCTLAVCTAPSSTPVVDASPQPANDDGEPADQTEQTRYADQF